MSQYFNNDLNVKSELHHFSYSFMGKQYSFVSDNGLFSKEHVDYASNLLIQNVGQLNGSLLDMGCGCGSIGIVLAGGYKLDLTMSDVNEKAVKYAKINAASNHVPASCMISDGFEQISLCYDNIVMNPPIHAGKNVIYKMYEDSLNHLNHEGKLYIVILKKHGAESTNNKLMEIYGNCTAIYKKKGFYIYECVNK